MPFRAARSGRRHRRRRLPRRRCRRRRHCKSPSATSMPRCSASAASAPRRRGYDEAVTFEQGNAEELPYPDRSFDCVTIAFGIRNVPRIDRALEEAHRVLQDRRPLSVPGILDGRRARARQLYELYSFQRDPARRPGRHRRPRGLSVSGRVDPQFSRRRRRFAQMIEAAGFRRVSFTPMTGGVVALHSGWRL